MKPGPRSITNFIYTIYDYIQNPNIVPNLNKYTQREVLKRKLKKKTYMYTKAYVMVLSGSVDENLRVGLSL